MSVAGSLPGISTAGGPTASGRTRRAVARLARALRQAFVAMRYSQLRTEARPSKRSTARQARRSVSCTRSSASSSEPSMR